VDLEDLRLTRIDPDLFEQGHQALRESIGLLARVPDLADSELSVGVEAEVVVQSVGRPVPLVLETTNAFVVLLNGRRRGVRSG